MFSASHVKTACNGMLPVTVYEQIYEAARATSSPYFVEVGTAHAAATVCLAMALKDTRRRGKVFTFEKITGGSREGFGNFDENVAIIRRNLEAFGVGEYVELILGDVSECADRVPRDLQLGMMLLDADGRIDRDFSLFYDRLEVGSPIFLDDVSDQVRLSKVGTRWLRSLYKIDQKHRIAHELLKVFKGAGLVDQGRFCGSATWHGVKLDKSMSAVDTEQILRAYRSLVFATADVSMVPFRRHFARLLTSIVPEGVKATLRRYT